MHFLKYWISILVLCLLFLFAGAWLFKKQLFVFYLSRELKTQVTLSDFSWESRSGFVLKGLTIYDPSPFPKKPALVIQRLSLSLSFPSLFTSEVKIEDLKLSDISLFITFSKEPKNPTNWSYLLYTKTPISRKRKKIQIKTLLLERLSVTQTSATGEAKTYPQVEKLELHNVSSEKFPLSEIEKAILREVLRSIFQKLNLPSLLKMLNPNDWTPSFFPSIPFFPKASPEKEKN